MKNFDTLPSVTVARDSAVDGVALWRVLSDLASLPEWAPGIDGAEITSETKSGPGTVRRVATAQFGPILHHVTEWDEGKGFAYETADSGPFSQTLTRYCVSAHDDQTATVTVSLAFEIKPGAIETEQAKAVLTKGLTATLQALELRARMCQPAYG